jgi:hypothetical protein
VESKDGRTEAPSLICSGGDPGDGGDWAEGTSCATVASGGEIVIPGQYFVYEVRVSVVM